MVTLDKVQTSNWQLASSAFGLVVEGSESLNQSIGLVLSTRPGSDPFRPTFGSTVWDFLDTPVNTAGPNIVNAIREAVTRWVPEVVLESVTYVYQDSYGDSVGVPSGLRFNITWTSALGLNRNELLLLMNTQGTGQSSEATIIRILAVEDGTPLLTEGGQYIVLA